jgi:hypothetical protein
MDNKKLILTPGEAPEIHGKWKLSDLLDVADDLRKWVLAVELTGPQYSEPVEPISVSENGDSE